MTRWNDPISLHTLDEKFEIIAQFTNHGIEDWNTLDLKCLR